MARLICESQDAFEHSYEKCSNNLPGIAELNGVLSKHSEGINNNLQHHYKNQYRTNGYALYKLCATMEGIFLLRDGLSTPYETIKAVEQVFRKK